MKNIMTGNKIVFAIGLFLLVALFVLGIRWHQQTTFRNQMRPLIQEDLSDFAQEVGSNGGLVIGPAIARREKLIAKMKLFEVGRYRHVRDLVVQLMEAENSYLADDEAAYENGIQIQTDATQMKLALSQLKISSYVSKEEECSAMKDALSTIDRLIDHVRLESELPELIEADRKKGVGAWNQSYGWMRWMGLDVDPHNPFSSAPIQSIPVNFWKNLLIHSQGQRSGVAKGMATLCGGTE
ncbi:MAG TPA: hypothetical protein VFC10_19100 [Terriglobia bacterium]|nr:hypothetical protein [Terriglobia bacterium]